MQQRLSKVISNGDGLRDYDTRGLNFVRVLPLVSRQVFDQLQIMYYVYWYFMTIH